MLPRTAQASVWALTTDSENNLGWKRPLQVSQSNPLLKTWLSSTLEPALKLEQSLALFSFEHLQIISSSPFTNFALGDWLERALLKALCREVKPFSYRDFLGPNVRGSAGGSCYGSIPGFKGIKLLRGTGSILDPADTAE